MTKISCANRVVSTVVFGVLACLLITSAGCWHADSLGDSESSTDMVDTDSETDTFGDPISDCQGVITFPDPNLENVVREYIEMPTGDIYSSDVADLKPLVKNSGIHHGDTLRVNDNLLECDQEDLDDINALEARGVDLEHDCY